MAVTVKITNGDLDFSDANRLGLVRGSEFENQRIRDICKIRKGEIFSNTEVGLNFDLVFEKSATDEDVALGIRECLLSLPEVSEVLSTTVERTVDRKGKVTVNLRKTTGETTQEVIAIG